MRRIPVLATLLVLAAVGLMIALGFWQLDRLREKKALLAHYAAAQNLAREVDWPRDAGGQEDLLYRHARLDCVAVAGHSSIAGRNA